MSESQARDEGTAADGAEPGEPASKKANKGSSAPKDSPPGASKPGAAARSGPVRRGLRGLGIVLLALLVILVAKALLTRSKQVVVDPAEGVPVDEAKAAQHLSRAITFKTISHQEAAKNDPAAFQGLHAALQEMFPKAHQTLTREVVGEHSLLYTWKGKDPSKAPVLLMAHMDVVPIETGTEPLWEKPPFEGTIADGFVWGRGAMDFKDGVVGILEAAEALLAQGFTPERTVYLAFGHDEEVSGLKGAQAISALLASRNVKLAYVLDEGMFVTQGILKGIDAPVALIGLAEKGYVTVELVVEAQGGHSSVPPRPTAIGILAHALVRLENHPMPARIEGPAKALFETLAPEMPFGNKLILSNLWLLSPVAKAVLSGNPATDAMLRTTTAPTMLEGSVKENVLPARARAVVNFRILPGDTIASVLDHVNRTISDPRVKASALEGNGQEPSPVSPLENPGYRSIERTVRQIFQGAIVAPSLVLGATDSRHYQKLADGVYRFSPLRMGDTDRPRFHGTNERISTKNFAECIRFYAQLIKNTDSL